MPKLRRAWQAVSDRHAVLRTGFVWRGLSGSPQQIVYRRAEVPFVEDDWCARVADWDEAELEAALADVSRQEQAAGFDLSRPPLQRVRLIRLGDDRHWLIWTHHHILFDGWSSARLISEVMQHHGAGRLPALQHRYRDYIAWLQNRAGDVVGRLLARCDGQIGSAELFVRTRRCGIVRPRRAHPGAGRGG